MSSPRTAFVVAALVGFSSCSHWRAYRQPVDEQTSVRTSAPRAQNGRCERTVSTTTTTTYDRAYRFSTGIDLYIAAGSMALGWLFVGTSFIETSEPNHEQVQRDRLTAGLVLVGFSLPFWTYFLVNRLNKPSRAPRAIEVVRTSDELEELERRECP